jgi:hypothetical protein
VTTEILDWRPPVTIHGALDPTEAPLLPLSPKADWVDDEPGKLARGEFGSILQPGETRWFRLDLWEEESAWIWADLEWPPGLDAGGALETIVLDSTGREVQADVGHGGIPLRREVPSDERPTIGAAVGFTDEGWPEAETYLVGMRWDAPAEVFLGSLLITVEVLGDPQRYTARTEIEGALDPADAPVLPLAGSPENGPEWRGGEFRGPLASGETRWYRLDLERGEVMNVLALFPGDRYVGDGTEGEFTILLTDGDGASVGSAFDWWPQMSQRFGDERHQATVSGTTSFDPDPVPETVLLGFAWEGPPGQVSEVRFGADAIFDSGRKAVADQIEAGQPDDAGNDTVPEESDADTTVTIPQTTEQSTMATATSTTIAAAADDSGEGGLPLPLVIGGGIVLLGAVVLLVRQATTKA